MLVLSLLASESEIVAAQPVDAVTVEQPKIMPGQFIGDLRKLPRVTSEVGAPPAYRRMSSASTGTPPAIAWLCSDAY